MADPAKAPYMGKKRVVITFSFDVLARPGADLATRQPDPDGTKLWHMFHQATMGNMCIVSDESYDPAIFEHWLMVNGFKAATYEFFDSIDPVVKAEKVHLISTVFGRAGWYVDTDPRTIALTISKGIPSLLVGSPFTIRPEWEADRKVTPWDDVVAEIDRQKLKAVSRTWREMDE